MAKKILYKVTAYHCPRCGGVTDPKKKYCDYCSRDLEIRRKENKRQIRMLIDCGNYVFFDEVRNIKTTCTPTMIEVSTLADGRCSFIKGRQENTLSVTMATDTERGRELSELLHSGIHKVRFELLYADLGYEQECYVTKISQNFYSAATGLQEIDFVGVGEAKTGGAIPQEVLDEFTCPNCGAPILSRYGACTYCSGWSEVDW